MTVIVYRDGVMAADSMVCAGSRYAGDVNKLARASDGTIGGAAATYGACARFRNWLSGGRVGEFKPDEEDFGALIVEPDGSVYRMDRNGAICQAPTMPYHIEGSAEDIAAGALEHDATAEEAVAICCRLNPGGCRGPVRAEYLPSTLRKAMTRKPIRYEGSPADRRADRSNARKAGVPVKKWEGSAADERADAAARAKLRKNRKK